ncbi:Thioredoxin [Epsilonproteobacteria bacterium SCGC AD-308-P11]|jgi:thiol:disulfide interchange protein DsbC|nr:Thioredoxin [Epsilonproteobacteria bacterium SCGC AD-308-P11]SMP89514.1 Thioredoxin [Epsilonproteobacteria bacterium SCGC AD-311-C15]
MLSTSKLLLSILLLSNLLYAKTATEAVEDFLENSISQNPNIDKLDVNVVDTIKVEQLKGWDAYVVIINATLKKDKKKVSQKMIWFSDGKIITKELTLMEGGESLADLVKPSFKEEYYRDENLVYGNKNAKHKVAIFSDPLCPFCRTFVPESIEYMKKEPNKFAIYYFNFPLPAIHPASVELVKAEIAAELQGHKDVLLKLYKVEIDPREKDINKILAAFNKATGLSITPADVESKKVIDRFNEDLKIADNVMVQGTPTMFFDGKIDRAKNTYKKVK